MMTRTYPYFKADTALQKPGRGLPITSISFMGDSITSTAVVPESGVVGAVTYQANYPPHVIAQLEKNLPVIGWGATQMCFAEGGKTVGYALSTYVPLLEALSVKPSHCIINLGVNDTYLALDISEIVSGYEVIITRLRAAGIEPIVVTPTPAPIGGSNSYWRVELMNRELQIMCSRLDVIFVDVAKVLELTDKPGCETPGMLSDNTSTGGLHPKGQTHRYFADQIGKAIKPYLDPSLPSIWDEGVAVNLNPNWVSAIAQHWPGTNTTAAITYAARTGGVTGERLLETTLSITGGLKTIGTGNQQISFAAAAGVSQNDYDVWFRLDTTFSNGGNPYVLVTTERNTRRKLIMVWGETTATWVSTSSVAQVVAAINTAAAGICVASTTGTTEKIVAGQTCLSHQLRIADQPEIETNLAVGDRIRLLAEVWMPAGAHLLSASASNFLGTGRAGPPAETGNVGPKTSITALGGLCSVPIPTSKTMIVTPWYLLPGRAELTDPLDPTKHPRRFFADIAVGGAAGKYVVGRCWIQKKNP